jgi:hypothetical protein
MPDPHLRAADNDRAAVATVLGQHMAAGRLTVDEYDERLSRAYAARTYGELDQLTADLPSTRRQQPQPVAHAQPARGCGPVPGHWSAGGSVRDAWRSWLGTALIVLTIWAVSSIASTSFLYFWPIWVIGPWGAVLLARTLGGGGSDRYPRRRHRDWAQYR